MNLRLAGLIALMMLSGNACAWFIFFPIPSFAKPVELQSLIEALEKSEETRAVAFVSEDKSFGAKRWLWGKYVGLVSQEEANRRALEICRLGLATAKEKMEGGQKLYDFGNKDCELYLFTPNDGPKRAESKRKADEAEAKRLAEIDEAKKVAVEEERKRILADEVQKRVVIEDEVHKREEPERATSPVRVSGKGELKNNAAQRPTLASVQSVGVDFNAEAIKSARILGCQSTDLKVTGAEAGSILYSVKCSDARTLDLACDKAGLCLRR